MVVNGKTWDETYCRAESVLAGVATWLTSNLLTLNVSKTNFIAFSKTAVSSPPENKTIKFHSCVHYTSASSFCHVHGCACQEIERRHYVKYLGLLIDQHLSFKQHLYLLASRVRKIIYVVKRLRDCAAPDVLRLVYHALCQSILQYGVAIWGSAAKCHILQVERAQRAVLKVMLKKPFRYPTDTLYRECGFLRVRQLYIMKAVSRTHSCLLNSAHYEEILSRRIYKAPLPPLKSALARKSPAFSHPYVYNNICKYQNIKKLSTLQARRVVKKWLLTISYAETECLVRIPHTN